jgi:anthranilate phosphoribosyltransferase
MGSVRIGDPIDPDTIDPDTSMSNAFREYLRKIGSGPHTGSSLTREEAKSATEMMLQQVATPAQIGGFLIAHRIRRPTGEELAGMLDAYQALGPQIAPIESAHPVVILGNPYDGRSRTAPLTPLIALVLASMGIPVITHGGDRMPTKAGVPLIELWQGLGIAWEKFDLAQVREILLQTGLGFVYLPRHFPLAQGLVKYREEIGKRPPLATLELMWSPYAGSAHQICGFVHPPTENMFRAAFALHNINQFTTVKGLEGSCDLARDRPSIIGENDPKRDGDEPFERLILHPGEFFLAAKELPIATVPETIAMYHEVLAGVPSPMLDALKWNAGYYLWRCGGAIDLASGMKLTQELLASGKVAAKLTTLREALARR